MATKSNTLTGGLQMAFHPLNADKYADKLTNALNATLVTDNGNYNTLQQELGNARVESAFLPCGYIPLGCSEFGGVMYIVSYNPFTGKSQIGSFPSPERNITSDEIDGSMDNKVTYDMFFDKDADASKMENGLVSTYTKIYPIGEDVLLKPGDEFFNIILNSSAGHQQADSLLDYDVADILSRNGYTGLVKITMYAKNKNGNTTDITDTLRKVYDVDGDTNKDYPFYIYEESQKPDIDEFISNFNRNDSPYIIWNQNYSGELVANIELEVLTECNVAIDTNITTENGTTFCNITFIPSVDKQHEELWKKGVYEYNGKLYMNPDDIPSGEIYTEHKGGMHIKLELQDASGNVLAGSKKDAYYDANNQTFDFSIDDYQNDYHFLYYEVTPYMYFGDVDNLMQSGIIDLSKVNSGKYEVTKWKYYNGLEDDGLWHTTLSAHIDYYPKDGSYIKSAKFSVYNLIAGDLTPFTYDCPQFCNMGDCTLELRESDGFVKDGVYLMVLNLEEYNGDGTLMNPRPINERAFVLNTTTMYNDEYINSKILDFNTLEPKAYADVVVSLSPKENDQQQSILAPYNKYNGEVPFTDEQLNRGNTIYSRYHSTNQVSTSLTPRYNVFSVVPDSGYRPSLSFSFGSYDIDGQVVVSDSEYASSYYKDFNSSIINNNVKEEDYENEYDKCWISVSYDPDTMILSRTANIHVTAYSDQDQTHLDYNCKMVSMMSDEMADKFWKSKHRRKDSNKPTMLMSESKGFPEGEEPKNKFTECNLLFYLNRGSFTQSQKKGDGRKTWIMYSGCDTHCNLNSATASSDDGYYSFWRYTDTKPSGSHTTIRLSNVLSSTELSYGDTWKPGSYRVYHDTNFLESDNSIFITLGNLNTTGAPGAMFVSNYIHPCNFDYKIIRGNSIGKGLNIINAGNVLAQKSDIACIDKDGDYKSHLIGSQVYHNYSLYSGRCPIFVGSVNNSEQSNIHPLSRLDYVYKKYGQLNEKNSIHNDDNMAYPGGFFMFASNETDNFSDRQYISDYMFFPTGLSHDDIEVSSGLNRIPSYIADGNFAVQLDNDKLKPDFEKATSITTAYLIEKNITREADFGQPVYMLFEQVYIPYQSTYSSITNFFILKNNTYCKYNYIKYNTLYNLESDSNIAGTIKWSNGYIDLKPLALNILEIDSSQWNNSNLTIDCDELSMSNGNLYPSMDNKITLTAYVPDYKTLIKKLTYVDTDIVYIDNDGNYTLTDANGDKFEQKGIYHIDKDLNELYRFDQNNDSDCIQVDFSVSSKMIYTKFYIKSTIKRRDTGDYDYDFDNPKTIESTEKFSVFFYGYRWKVSNQGDLIVDRSHVEQLTYMAPMAVCFNGGDDGKDGCVIEQNDKQVKTFGGNLRMIYAASHWLNNDIDTDISGPGESGKYKWSNMTAMAHFFYGEKETGVKMYNILGPKDDNQ